MKFDVEGDVVVGDVDVDFIVGSDCRRDVNVGVVVVRLNVASVVVFSVYWRCCLFS